MQKILILESSAHFLNQVRIGLVAQQCVVVCALSVEQARRLLRKETTDLLIYSIDGSFTEGIDFLEELQEQRATLKIIVLSAITALQKRLAILQLADELLDKSCHLNELTMRAINFLALHKIKDKYLIDNNTFLLRDSSDSVQYQTPYFRPREIKILECLLRHKNLLVTYETITQFVWGYAEITPLNKTISVYIRRIRSKIARERIKIITFKNRGYKLIELKEADI